MLISVTIPEVAGAFKTLYEKIYPRNITEFSYRCVRDESVLVRA